MFTTRQAIEIGISTSMLRGRRFLQIHRGVWRLATTSLSLELHVHAARLAAPGSTAVSHVTALQWWGVEVGSTLPVHLSTTSSAQTKSGIVLHRRVGTLSPVMLRHVPVLGPERSFVDCGTVLSLRQLVRAGDRLVRLGLTTPLSLRTYADDRHLDGVVRAREAAALVRARVDSVRETDVRLLMVLAGLPEPQVNVDVYDDSGTWIARGDLVLPMFRIIVEHDGWHHERDAAQRQKDHLRRERIEAASWTLIVITVEDFGQPASIVARVYEALRRRGYAGPPPELGRKWTQVARNL